MRQDSITHRHLRLVTALACAAFGLMAQFGTAAAQGTSSSAEKPSYDPIPPAWSVQMDMPGWLMVGAKYCTDRGKCETVGAELGAVPVPGGGSAPAVIGCAMNPEYPACVQARVPVQLLAQRPPLGSVIVRLNERNYAISGQVWAIEKPDGSAIGGPIMIESEGEILPLHYYQRGMTKAARQAQLAKIDAKRKAALANVLGARRKRCDELLSVTKSPTGSFIATCTVKNGQKTYEESISGLE